MSGGAAGPGQVRAGGAALGDLGTSPHAPDLRSAEALMRAEPRPREGWQALSDVRTLEVGGRAISLGWAEVGSVGVEALTGPERALLSARATGVRVAQFSAGRAAARSALRGLGLEIDGRSILRRAPPQPDAGRPLLVDAAGRPDARPLSLSLTHSGGLACAAAMVGAQKVGIDLEWEPPSAAGAFVEEAFAPGELEGFSHLRGYGADPIAVAWTLKEAALKVWGVGLRAVLPAVQLIPERAAPAGIPGSFTFACALRIGPQPVGLPPPPGRLECLCVLRGESVLSVALEV